MGQGEAWWLEPVEGGGGLRWWVATGGRQNSRKTPQSHTARKNRV